MRITTNFIVNGIGNFCEKKQHILKFGNLWNIERKKDLISPKLFDKIIGLSFFIMNLRVFPNI